MNEALGLPGAFVLEEADHSELKLEITEKLGQLPAVPLPTLTKWNAQKETAQPPRKRGRPLGSEVVRPGKLPRKTGTSS